MFNYKCGKNTGYIWREKKDAGRSVNHCSNDEGNVSCAGVEQRRLREMGRFKGYLRPESIALKEGQDVG